jgi:hypothetical protein
LQTSHADLSWLQVRQPLSRTEAMGVHAPAGEGLVDAWVVGLAGTAVVVAGAGVLGLVDAWVVAGAWVAGLVGAVAVVGLVGTAVVVAGAWVAGAPTGTHEAEQVPQVLETHSKPAAQRTVAQGGTAQVAICGHMHLWPSQAAAQLLGQMT